MKFLGEESTTERSHPVPSGPTYRTEAVFSSVDGFQYLLRQNSQYYAECVYCGWKFSRMALDDRSVKHFRSCFHYNPNGRDE